MKNGPQTLQWIRSNGKGEKWWLLGKVNFFCLACGQIVHGVSGTTNSGTNLFKNNILEKEGWLNLLCQSSNKEHLEDAKHAGKSKALTKLETAVYETGKIVIKKKKKKRA